MVVGRRSPFFFLGFLFCALGGLGSFLGGGGNEGVDREEEEDDVDGTIDIPSVFLTDAKSFTGEGTYSMMMLTAKLLLACMQ
jgi:hypothetical protein